MKTIFLLTTIFTFVVAYEASNDVDILTNLELELDREVVTEFLEKYEERLRSNDIGEITTVVDEYADKLFPYITKFAIAHHLDPVVLTDVKQNFLIATITLINGALHGISSIDRYDDVELTYLHDLNTLRMSFPIEFTNLNFTYDYHLLLLLLGPEGSMTGKIKNFKADVELSFDFNNYHVKLEKLKTTNTGSVSLTFQGNGILDLVVNILSEFVTTILHPLIVGIIEGLIKSAANKVVVTFNTGIDHMLHPNATQLTLSALLQSMNHI